MMIMMMLKLLNRPIARHHVHSQPERDGVSCCVESWQNEYCLSIYVTKWTVITALVSSDKVCCRTNGKVRSVSQHT